MATQNVRLRSKEKQGNDKTKTKSKSKSTKKKSRLPFWFLLTALIMLSFIFGSMIGYGVVGDHYVGDRGMLEVFNMNTWSHMYDLIFTE